jgi:hypothetical protein
MRKAGSRPGRIWGFAGGQSKDNKKRFLKAEERKENK